MNRKSCHGLRESRVGDSVSSFHRCFFSPMFLVLKRFGLSEQEKLWILFLTIGTQRNYDVFRFVHSGCKGCDGEICMCEINVGAFSHVVISRIRAPTSPWMDTESTLLRV